LGAGDAAAGDRAEVAPKAARAVAMRAVVAGDRVAAGDCCRAACKAARAAIWARRRAAPSSAGVRADGVGYRAALKAAHAAAAGNRADGVRGLRADAAGDLVAPPTMVAKAVRMRASYAGDSKTRAVTGDRAAVAGDCTAAGDPTAALRRDRNAAGVVMLVSLSSLLLLLIVLLMLLSIALLLSLSLLLLELLLLLLLADMQESRLIGPNEGKRRNRARHAEREKSSSTRAMSTPNEGRLVLPKSVVVIGRDESLSVRAPRGAAKVRFSRHWNDRMMASSTTTVRSLMQNIRAKLSARNTNEPYPSLSLSNAPSA
jgi:hypothetical protein